MIHLDTNYLIRLLLAGSDEAKNVSVWLGKGEKIGVSSIVWMEFICGPVTDQEVAQAATRNVNDFELFRSDGLKLIG